MANNSAYDPLAAIKIYLEDEKPSDPSFRNYLINRLGDQLIWYDSKSTKIKKYWVRRRIFTIVLSALIPFAVGYIDAQNNPAYLNTALKVFVGASGVAIAILEALNSLFKSQELYIDYRGTAEQLKQEFSFFLGRTGDYKGNPEEDYPKLVAKLEGIMAAQNNKWMDVVRRNEESAQSEEIKKKVEENLRQLVLTTINSGPQSTTSEQPPTNVQTTTPVVFDTNSQSPVEQPTLSVPEIPSPERETVVESSNLPPTEPSKKGMNDSTDAEADSP